MYKRSFLRPFQRGFSLVELSIVLVILGLLIGGVLSGQSLIRAAELRTVTTDYSKYIAGINGFRDKYFALPGDMPNATQIWGISTSCPYTASTDAKTCDGDGDGTITGSGNCLVMPKLAEPTRMWQHLANAGLIEGQFNGISGAPSKLNPASIWYPTTIGVVSGSSATFDGDYGTTLELTRPGFVRLPCSATSMALAIANGPGSLKPEDAWNIDTKLDDGKPATGKVRVFTPAGLNVCTDSSDSTNMAANYLLSSTDKNCGLYFANAIH